MLFYENIRRRQNFRKSDHQAPISVSPADKTWSKRKTAIERINEDESGDDIGRAMALRRFLVGVS